MSDSGTPDPYRTPDGSTPDPYRAGGGNPSGTPGGAGDQGGLPRYGAMSPDSQPTPPLYGADGQQSYGGGQGGYQGYPGQQQGYQGQQPYYAQGYPGQPGGASMADNQLGNWSIGLAIASFFCLGFLGSIPAIILGMKGRRAAAQGRATNGGTATAGLVIGWVVTIFSLLGLVMIIWVVSVIGWAGFEEFFDPAYWEELERELERQSLQS